jgi:hypothetical protein
VEDVLVGAKGGGRKIGGDVKKCVAGLKCELNHNFLLRMESLDIFFRWFLPTTVCVC